MKLNETSKEARRLHSLGFAVIWLHPKSKRPVDSGWTSGERSTWEYLKETYIDNLNVGVRLGAPSKIGKGYLAVLDVDIKGTEPEHRKDALAAAKAFLGDAACPEVNSGRGGGSRHYYFLTKEPFKTWNPAQSEEVVKVHMPSKKPSKAELLKLTPKEIEQGLRLSHAWEISCYSSGRQVVLPPSIHPDSGKMYLWKKHLHKADELPLIDVSAPEKTVGNPKEKKSQLPIDFHFTPEVVDIEWLAISDEIRSAIVDGLEGDRSSQLPKICSALFSCGLDPNQVLSVLTDEHFKISDCGYDRRGRGNRLSAAQWFHQYTVTGVVEKRNPKNIFTSAVVPGRTLTKEEIEADTLEWKEGQNWRNQLVRSGQKGEGPPKGLIQNIVLIMNHSVGEDLAARNTFAYRDTFLTDTPWGAKKDDLIGDDDTPKIKLWLSQNFGFEPKSQTIEESLVVLACENKFDPVRESFDELPKWDEKPRLDTWLVKNFSATGNSAYNAEIFRKWVVAMVMRVYEPGSKFDWMPIFEGPQRAGKSSFGKIMAGGEKHFLDWLPNLHDKDAALALQGMWVVEMGELASMRKNEIEVVKGFVTRTVDKVRPPFGRRMIESPRRCVFFGTTNRDQYLQDDTGNRRFKPLLVGRLNFKALRADRDQLFAEAKYLWENKIETERTLDQLSTEAAEYEKTVHADKMIRDDSNSMFDILSDFISSPKSSENFDFEKFKLYELFQAPVGSAAPPLSRYRLDKRNEMMASKAVRMLGGSSREINGRNYWKMPKPDKKAAPLPPGTAVEFSEEELTF